MITASCVSRCLNTWSARFFPSLWQCPAACFGRSWQNYADTYVGVKDSVVFQPTLVHNAARMVKVAHKTNFSISLHWCGMA